LKRSASTSDDSELVSIECRFSSADSASASCSSARPLAKLAVDLSRRLRSGQSSSQSENTKDSQPTIKQGVKGADDDLYQEYREQQRYLQKRERKK